PINPSTLSAATLSLTLDGGPNLLDSNNLTITPVPGTADAYAIGGLGALTTTDGTYVLTLLTGRVTDLAGDPRGGGNAPPPWLIDTLAPSSHVSPLPQQETSLNFTVSAAGTDPAPGSGGAPSGIASYDLYVSDDGASFAFWTTVPAKSPTAVYMGQS